MAILDLYKKGEFKLGVDHSKAGGKNPVTTDYIKGITPQQVTLNTDVDAAQGFVANRTPADRNKSDFSMLNKDNNGTQKEFNPLDINDDYFVGSTKVTGYNPTKPFNGGALTNPKG